MVSGVDNSGDDGLIGENADQAADDSGANTPISEPPISELSGQDSLQNFDNQEATASAQVAATNALLSATGDVVPAFKEAEVRLGSEDGFSVASADLSSTLGGGGISSGFEEGRRRQI